MDRAMRQEKYGESPYLTTGELAQMLGVSKQTVLHYDRVGLLSPAGRGPQNYRRYTLDQADELDTILTLRNLGVSIEEIKDYLRQKSPARCIQMLRRQEEFAEEEIRRLERLRRKLSKRASILEQVLSETDYDQVSYLRSENLEYLFEPCRDDSEKERLQSFINLCKRSQELQIDFENPVCAVIPMSRLEEIATRPLAGYAILLPAERLGQHPALTRPAGWYAVTYHRGPANRLPDTYLRLAGCIREDGFEICGDAYEEDLFSILTSADPEEYLRRIVIQVRREG